MPQLVWFITGCATGFGEKLVHDVLGRGDKVIATARNASSRLQAQKEAGAAILELDVTGTQQTLDDVVNQALKIYGTIDVLVNNASYIEAGFLEEVGDERMRNVFSTNFFGAINLSRAVLPHFRERKTGTLVFMSSYTVWEGQPTPGAYVASKGALESGVLCLEKEVAAFGIKTCTVINGLFRTEIFGPRNMKYGAREIPAYAEGNKWSDSLVTQMYEHSPGDPAAGAARIVDAVRSEGTAEGKEVPSFLVLGQEALDAIRARCKAMLKICDEGESVAQSTATGAIPAGQAEPKSE